MSTQHFKIFWIGEDSEKYAAESIEQLLQNQQQVGDIEDSINEGEYGEIEHARNIRLRKSEESAELYEGTIGDLVQQLMAEGEKLPFMISTAYW